MFKRKLQAKQANEGTCRLRAEDLDLVAGGRIGDGDKIVIVGCTTPPPFGGYRPGTIIWNPWINPRAPS